MITVEQFKEKIKIRNVIDFCLVILCVSILCLQVKSTRLMQVIVDSDFVNMEREFNNVNKKINSKSKKSRKNIEDKVFKDFEENINEDLKEIDQRRKEIEKDFEENERTMRKVEEKSKNTRKRRTRKQNNNSDLTSFNTSTYLNKDKNEYVINVKVPKNIKMEDVKVDFKNSLISINIEKKEDEKGKDFEFSSSNSFFQSFTTPKTTAENKDLKIKLDNGKLNIVVPLK